MGETEATTLSYTNSTDNIINSTTTVMATGSGNAGGFWGLTDQGHVVVVSAALAIGVLAVLAVLLRLLMPFVRRRGRPRSSTPLVPGTPSTQLSRASSRDSILEMGWGDNSTSKTCLTALGSKNSLLHTSMFPGHAHNGKMPMFGGSNPALGRYATPMNGSGPALNGLTTPIRDSNPSLFNVATPFSGSYPSVREAGASPRSGSSHVSDTHAEEIGSASSLSVSRSSSALEKLGRSPVGLYPSLSKMGVPLIAYHAHPSFRGTAARTPMYLPSSSSLFSNRRSQSLEDLSDTLIAVISPTPRQLHPTSLQDVYRENWENTNRFQTSALTSTHTKL